MSKLQVIVPTLKHGPFPVLVTLVMPSAATQLLTSWGSPECHPGTHMAYPFYPFSAVLTHSVFSSLPATVDFFEQFLTGQWLRIHSYLLTIHATRCTVADLVTRRNLSMQLLSFKFYARRNGSHL